MSETNSILSFFSRYNRTDYALFFCWMLIFALVWSKFLLTVSMIGLLTAVVFSFDASRKIPVFLNPQLGAYFREFRLQKAFWIISLFFFIVLFSGFYTHDMQYWLERLRIKLPFLLLPFVFAVLPKFSYRQFMGIFYLLLLVMCYSSMNVGANYLLHFNEINESIAKGHPIPTPMNHIRFSLLMAISIIGGIVLFAKNFYWKGPGERWLILTMTAFLFYFIHVLAVRSGLLCLYGALLAMVLQYAFAKKNILLGIFLAAGLVLLPLIAIKTVPSLEKKIGYAMWDYKMHHQGKGQEYSDSGRMLSYKIGWDIFRENPVLGVGAGDLKQTVHEVYKNNHPKITAWKMPHNQYLSVLAGTGIVGLLCFLAACFFPLFYQKNYRNPLFLAISVSLLLSFLVENTIENAIGVAIYIFFVLLCLNFGKEEVKENYTINGIKKVD